MGKKKTKPETAAPRSAADIASRTAQLLKDGHPIHKVAHRMNLSMNTVAAIRRRSNT